MLTASGPLELTSETTLGSNKNIVLKFRYVKNGLRRGIFNGLLNNLKAFADGLKDNRRKGFNLKYKLIYALKSTLSVFFFQHPSMLDFQAVIKQKWKRCNLETMMGGTKNTEQCAYCLKRVIKGINVKMTLILVNCFNSKIVDFIGYFLPL